MLFSMPVPCHAITENPDKYIYDEIDWVEINHFTPGGGRAIFNQAIFWEYSIEEDKLQMVDWKMIKNGSINLTGIEQKKEIDKLKEEAYQATLLDAKARLKPNQRIIESIFRKFWDNTFGKNLIMPDVENKWVGSELSTLLTIPGEKYKILMFRDHKVKDMIRKIRVRRGLFHSYTLYDVELEDRKVLPEDERRKLSGLNKVLTK